ncbi:MAG: ABC transporter permease [Flavobacteriales bacterium]|nr:ABC transporter permease [Flavobacteriales bacterium]
MGTLMVNSQFRFMQEKDPGFDESSVIVMSTKQQILQQFEAFRTEVLADESIESVTVMNDIIGEDHNVFEYNYEGMQPDKWQYLPSLIVDAHFVSTMGLELVAGRDFNEDIKSDDTAAVLVNETLVREMGWGTPQEALGQRMTTPRGRERVVGVLKDFHYVSLNEPVRPFVLDMIKQQGFWIQEFAVRVKPGMDQQAIAHLEEAWGKFGPQFPFEYFFLEDRLDTLYQGQNTLRILVGLFSIVAIVISCIGLFALTSLSVEQRTKEIGYSQDPRC